MDVARTVALVHGSEGHRPPGKRSGARHHSRVVRVADEQRGSGGALQDFGLGVGDRIRRRKEAEVRVADVRPHTDVRLRDLDQSADLPCVVHAQFHHRNIRPRAQLHERQRQADVVVQIPLVLHHAKPRGQQFRDRFLRRRLARTARDGDDLRLGGHPHRVRQVLQRAQRVGDLDHRALAGPRIRTQRRARRSPPPRRARAPRPRTHDRRTAVPSAPRRDRRAGAIGCRSSRPRSRAREPLTAAHLRPSSRPTRGSVRARSPRSRLHPPRLQRLPSHRDVVEREPPPGDLLVFLVALAGDQHDVPRRRRRAPPAESPRGDRPR